MREQLLVGAYFVAEIFKGGFIDFEQNQITAACVVPIRCGHKLRASGEMNEAFCIEARNTVFTRNNSCSPKWLLGDMKQNWLHDQPAFTWIRVLCRGLATISSNSPFKKNGAQ